MNRRKHPLLSFLFSIAFWASIVHVINKFIAAAATLNANLKTRDGEYYQWRFGKIFYTKQGSGSPVLLVHHLSPYSSSEEWKSVVDSLSQKHTVYALDLLGCGRSDKPPALYSNFLYVQLLTDFTKNIIGEKTDVVASRLSSSFVIMAAANEKDVFGKLILVNPDNLNRLNQVPDNRSKILKAVLELPLIGTFAYNIITSKTNIGLRFTEKYLYNPFVAGDSLVDTYYEAAHTQGGNGKYLLASILGKYVYFNISYGLSTISNKILVVGGSGNENFKEMLEEYTSLNKTVKNEIIPNSKLFPQLEAPDMLAQAIQKFNSTENTE